MNEDYEKAVERWEAALAEADKLLETKWRVDHGTPGQLYDDVGNELTVSLEVWYLRRAMTIGRGWASQTRET